MIEYADRASPRQRLDSRQCPLVPFVELLQALVRECEIIISRNRTSWLQPSWLHGSRPAKMRTISARVSSSGMERMLRAPAQRAAAGSS